MRVLAHGLGGRADLPIPVWLAQYVAAMVLIVSFFVLAKFWQAPAAGALPRPAPAHGAAAAGGRPGAAARPGATDG